MIVTPPVGEVTVDPEMLVPTPTTVKTEERLSFELLVAAPVAVITPDCESLTTLTIDHDNVVKSAAAAGEPIIAIVAMTSTAYPADKLARFMRMAPPSQRRCIKACKLSAKYERHSV